MVSEPLCPCQVKRSEERDFYLRMAAGQRWSVREVARQASPRSATPIVIRADVRVAVTIAQLSSDGPQGSGAFDCYVRRYRRSNPRFLPEYFQGLRRLHLPGSPGRAL